MSDAAFSAVSAAYEHARVRWAMSRAALVAALALPTLAFGGSPSRVALLAFALFAVAATAGVRARGGLLGAALGALVAAVPVVVGGLVGGEHGCAGDVCFSWCGVACASAAGLAGAAAGVAFAGLRHGRIEFVAGALAAGALSTVACPAVGVGSLVGAVAGVALTLPPAAFVAVAVRKALA